VDQRQTRESNIPHFSLHSREGVKLQGAKKLVQFLGRTLILNTVSIAMKASYLKDEISHPKGVVGVTTEFFYPSYNVSLFGTILLKGLCHAQKCTFQTVDRIGFVIGNYTELLVFALISWLIR